MLWRRRTVDIYSKKRGPAGRLSNFTKRCFVFDGIECRSIEGVLQSFKFKTRAEQVIVCGLWGIQAKLAGERAAWKERQTVFWDGTEIARASAEYQQLLDRLYTAVYEQDEAFRRDLRRVRGRRLAHSIGSHDIRETILTEEELIARLTQLRDRADT